MKAITFESYGGIENLVLRNVQKPSPADDEVLVHVHAVSINDWDFGKMDGSSWFNRLLSGFSKPKHSILGSDIAGVIELVGKNVTQFKSGDRVYGDLSGKWGGFAEFVCANENALAKIPASMSFEQAAAIPQAGMLAVQALIDKGQIRDGEKVLINGAGGGVGTIGIQIAKLYRAEVHVVDSAHKLDMLRDLGAIKTIDYTQEDITKSSEKYDLILDVKTNRPVTKFLKILKPSGRYVTVGGSISLLLHALLVLPFISLFSKKKIGIVMLKPNKDLDYINSLFEKGKFVPVIDRPFTLEETPEAMRLFAGAKHKGKIVITVKGALNSPELIADEAIASER